MKRIKETKDTIIIILTCKVTILKSNNNNNNNNTAGELRENYTKIKLNLSKLILRHRHKKGGWGRDIHLSRRQCPTPESFDSAPQKA